MASHKIEEVLAGRWDGREVHLRGWIHRTRDSGSIVFPQIRDSTGVVQAIVKKGVVPDADFDAAKQALTESSVEVHGTVHPDPRAPGGYEVKADRFTVVTFSPTFPLLGRETEEVLLDNRHLWLRGREATSYLRVRATVCKELRRWFEENGYWETHSPSFVSGACEGGSTLFKVEYFDHPGVFLTQSWQLYAEAIVMSLEKIFTMAPSFRAEKSRTRRHLAEYWHCEAEVAWIGLEELLHEEERLIEHVVRATADQRKAELELLKRDTAKLQQVKVPFPRVRYADAVRMTKERGVPMEYGEDFGTHHEEALTKGFETPFFVTHFPASVKPFYHRPDPANPGEVLCADMLAPEGIGEIIGSGERCYSVEELEARMKAENLDPAPYQWYIDLRRYGGVPHAGFGLGIDRLVRWITGAPHIQDVIPFPRTMRRAYP